MMMMIDGRHEGLDISRCGLDSGVSLGNFKNIKRLILNAVAS